MIDVKEYCITDLYVYIYTISSWSSFQGVRVGVLHTRIRAPKVGGASASGIGNRSYTVYGTGRQPYAYRIHIYSYSVLYIIQIITRGTLSAILAQL